MSSNNENVSQVIGEMSEIIRGYMQSVLDNECMNCITELSMMDLDILWSGDIRRCFSIDVKVVDGHILTSCDLNESEVIGLIVRKDSFGKTMDTNEYEKDVEYLHSIFDNFLVRIANGQRVVNQALETYKPMLMDAAKKDAVNKLKEVFLHD